MLRKLILMLLLVLLALPVAAQDEEIYTSPDGLYSFPIPTNWTVEEREGYVYLYSPEERLKVYIVVQEEQDDLEAATAEGIAVIDPDFDLPVLNVQELTDPALLQGFERGVVITYETEPSRIVTGGVSTFDGRGYFTFIDADLVALQERIAQLQLFSTGFEVAGMEEEADLSESRLLTDEDFAQLETFINRALENSDTPGLALAIVQGDEVVYANGFGVTEQGGDVPVTAETQMLVGSTTKPMTTMAIAQLIDEGALTWDTRVVELLPSFEVADPEITETLTVRNLMCACSGVPRRDLEIVFNQEDLTAEDIVAQLATFRFFTDFGEAFQYSNQMVAMGGFAAALADGAEFGNLMPGYYDLMQRTVFDPLAMDATTFSFEDVLAGDDYALPHGRNVDGELYPIPLAHENFVKPIAPAGGAWSTALDMANFLLNAMNTPADSALAEAWEPQIAITADIDYGLGWFIEDIRGRQFIGHDGNTLGFSTLMSFSPEDALGIVILNNGRITNQLNAIIRERLLELAFDLEPQVEAQLDDAETDEDSEPLFDYTDLETERLNDYLGEWTNLELGAITLALAADTLTLDAGDWVSEIRAYLNDDDEIEYIMYDSPLAGTPITFDEDEDGNPVIVVGMGVVEYTFTR